MSRALTIALHEKVCEQIERTEHLIRAVPGNAIDWAPPIDRPWTTATLLGHLVACLSGFCAALHRAEPERLAHLLELQSLLPASGVPEIRERFSVFARHVDRGFDAIEDTTLAKVVPTVFVPEGQSLLTLFLSNLEHLINHKHQLFMYLRWLGVNVTSEDLYRFR
jgi:hypothetical protein